MEQSGSTPRGVWETSQEFGEEDHSWKAIWRPGGQGETVPFSNLFRGCTLRISMDWRGIDSLGCWNPMSFGKLQVATLTSSTEPSASRCVFKRCRQLAQRDLIDVPDLSASRNSQACYVLALFGVGGWRWKLATPGVISIQQLLLNL